MQRPGVGATLFDRLQVPKVVVERQSWQRRPQIADMQKFLDRDLKARIFDVAMLAFSLGSKPSPQEPREMYPCVPMLTQGWSLLSAFGVTLPGRLGDFRGRLRPSLWTHFSPGSAGVLIETLRDGKVE